MLGNITVDNTVSDKCNDTRLSIIDFAQMSSIAYYLPNASLVESIMEETLPGWDIVHTKVYNTTNASFTTYMHLRRANTHVIALQGTWSAIEMLQDVNVWMPAAIVQFARSLGPSLFSVRDILMLIAPHFQQIAQNDTFFDGLVDYTRTVKQGLKENDKIYITGHSLGGGLAKVVGAMLHLQAITFSPPGLEATSAILIKGTADLSELRHKDVNVIPRSDLVPMVDGQLGTLLHIDCPLSNPIGCHSLSNTICELLASCGDGGGSPFARKYTRKCSLCEATGQSQHVDVCKAAR